MADPIVLPYCPRPLQWELHGRVRRWNALISHRRFGKTVFALNHAIRALLTADRPRPQIAYVAPYRHQAKSVAWDYALHYTGPIPGRSLNVAELRVDLPGDRRLYLLGADNANALRGLYLDGVIMDDYAYMAPSAWEAVLRPTLIDRKGWAMFIGTPFGRNHFTELYDRWRAREQAGDPETVTAFYPASRTDVLDPADLARERAEMSPGLYAQEYECNPDSALEGTYYAQELDRAATDGRIGRVPLERSVRVDTWWDLGFDDATAIVFTQLVGREIHVIDYYEASGEALSHYARVCAEKPYVYGAHHLPHDAAAHELSTATTRADTLRALGLRPLEVLEATRVEDGIEATRVVLERCWIDEAKCYRLLQALRAYRKKWNDKRRVFEGHPLHDWASHGADALRLMAMRQRRARTQPTPRSVPAPSYAFTRPQAPRAPAGRPAPGGYR
jgi:phage terminase large subunit